MLLHRTQPTRTEALLQVCEHNKNENQFRAWPSTAVARLWPMRLGPPVNFVVFSGPDLLHIHFIHIAEPSSSSPSSSSSKPRKKKDPSGGKPKAFAMAIEKMNQAASSNAIAKPKPRGGRKKALVAMYQSQLSDNTVGIKIRLKKSLATTIRKVEVSTPAPSSAPSSTSSATPMPSSSTSSRKKKASASPSTSSLAPTPSTSKSPRKRSRKSKHKETSDSDDSEYERKRPRNSNAAAGAQRRANRQPASSNNKDGYVEPEEQSGWGNAIPDHILLQIFDEAVNQHGALPLLVNLTRVCHLWRNVSLHPKLWHTMDLSSWTKEKTEFALKKITATHLRHCKEVNLGRQPQFGYLHRTTVIKPFLTAPPPVPLLPPFINPPTHSRLEGHERGMRARPLADRMPVSRGHLLGRLEEPDGRPSDIFGGRIQAHEAARSKLGQCKKVIFNTEATNVRANFVPCSYLSCFRFPVFCACGGYVSLWWFLHMSAGIESEQVSSGTDFARLCNRTDGQTVDALEFVT